MKDHNIYDFHSVYLKSQARGTENWERIEGVLDAQARFLSQASIKAVPLKKQKDKMQVRVSPSNSMDGIPGAVRRIVRFFHYQK